MSVEDDVGLGSTIDAAIYVEGERYGPEDLTFGEQREVRKLMKDANPDDPEYDVDDPPRCDLFPALVTVIRKRTDPDFGWDDALKVAPKDLAKPEEPEADPTEGDETAATPEPASPATEEVE